MLEKATRSEQFEKFPGHITFPTPESLSGGQNVSYSKVLSLCLLQFVLSLRAREILLACLKNVLKLELEIMSFPIYNLSAPEVSCLVLTYYTVFFIYRHFNTEACL